MHCSGVDHRAKVEPNLTDIEADESRLLFSLLEVEQLHVTYGSFELTDLLREKDTHYIFLTATALFVVHAIVYGRKQIVYEQLTIRRSWFTGPVCASHRRVLLPLAWMW